jgi:sec-independent protein translocase protein TatC
MTQGAMTFREHLTELRSRLIKSVVAIFLGAIVGLIFNAWIRDVLISPYREAVGLDEGGLAFLRPTEAFGVVMKVGLFGGAILASPVVLYQLWRFVSPALTKRERRYVVPLSVLFTVLFAAGLALGYWSLPRGLDFLLGFGGDDLDPVIQADAYLSFAMRFLLAFGIAFEFPVFTFAAAAVGVVSSRQLRAGWRWAVVAIVVGAAILTPSGDPLTLTLLSAPLYAMYELTILAVKYILKK